MKKILLIICFAIFLFPSLTRAEISASYNAWEVNDFSAVYNLNEDSSIDVQENIQVNFNEERHGIYRWIPTLYKDSKGFDYRLRLNLQGVYDKNDQPYNIADLQKGDRWRVKIGDPFKTLIGKNVYKINYSLERGIRFFEDHDEFYWNVTGDDWPEVIQASFAKVILPKSINSAELDLKCFTGFYGSTKEECSYEMIDNKTILFTGNSLKTREGFTIAIWFPKGFLAEPGFQQKSIWFLQDNWGFLIPVFVFLIMFLVWRRWGKDKRLKTIIAQYEPAPNITPTISYGVLKEMDISLGYRTLAAELVNLAVKGYLKIKEKDEDFSLIKLKEPGNDLKIYQQELLKALFKGRKSGKVKLNKLKNKFYGKLSAMREELASYVMGQRFYSLKPKWSLLFYVLGVFIMLKGFLFTDTFLSLGWGLVLSGLIVIIFGKFMPRRSQVGNEVLWQVKGLYEFIYRAERYRVKFQEKENIFEEILPYAMVFGLAKKWAKVFEDLYQEMPGWYETDQKNITFFSLYLTNRLKDFSKSSNSNLLSSPNSGNGYSGSSSSSGFSGGGSSGGGFGGGGGGSW